MKVLLIEDESQVAGIIRKALTEKGFSITVAPDGQLGLDLAMNNEFDIIILDIMLPGINGVQLCKNIRQQQIKTPTLFLTALGTTENIVAGLQAGYHEKTAAHFAHHPYHCNKCRLFRRSIFFTSNISSIPQYEQSPASHQ